MTSICQLCKSELNLLDGHICPKRQTFNFSSGPQKPDYTSTDLLGIDENPLIPDGG